MTIIELPSIVAMPVALPANSPEAVGLPGLPAPEPISLSPCIGTGSGSGSGQDQGLTFTFPQEAFSWTVSHNLGRRPISELIDQAGHEFFAEVVHINQNVFTVYFVAETAGSVRVY
jgi:hypothetical protein